MCNSHVFKWRAGRELEVISTSLLAGGSTHCSLLAGCATLCHRTNNVSSRYLVPALSCSVQHVGGATPLLNFDPIQILLIQHYAYKHGRLYCCISVTCSQNRLEKDVRAGGDAWEGAGHCTVGAGARYDIVLSRSCLTTGVPRNIWR